MTIEQAINEIKEDISLYIPLHGTIDDIDRDLPDGQLVTALEMAIRALRLTDMLKSRPCEACEHHEDLGCMLWNCPFEEVTHEE